MKKLNKIRVIEEPKADRPLTMNEMLGIEGGTVCMGGYISVEACSDFTPSCVGYYEDGLCKPSSSPSDLFCKEHEHIGLD